MAPNSDTSSLKSHKTQETSADSVDPARNGEISGPDHTEPGKKALLKKPKGLQKFLEKSSEACKNRLKRRRKPSTACQSPDSITEEERSKLRGGSSTRETLKKDGDLKFQLGVACFENEEYDMAKQYFHTALRAHLMTRGADHPDLAKIHKALGYIAILEKDTEKTEYHLNAVERLTKLKPAT